MASAPKYASAARFECAQVSAANTNRDGTGTIVDLITGVAAGTRIDRLRVVATTTTTAGVVRIYWHDGTNTRLYREYIVPAITPSTSVEVFSVEEQLFDLILPSASHKLRASTHVAETFNVFAMGSDLT